MKRIIIFTFITLYAMCAFSQKAKVGGIKYRVISSTEAEVDAGNTKLNKYIIPEYVTINGAEYKVTRIGDSAFCKYLGCNNLGGESYEYNKNLRSITIPKSVTSIGKGAFAICTNLKIITLPSSVTTIEKKAFYNCSSLTSIEIPNSVTSIGGNAFSGCEGLTNINIPNSVTRIEDYTFYGCKNLRSITIPNSVTSIGGFAFAHCSSLISIDIPYSVTSIGIGAFSDCNSIESIKGYNNCVIDYFVALPASNMYKWAKEKSISYSYYAYNRITKLLQEWQQKKEYETTAQWQARVTEETRAEELKKIQKLVLEDFIEQRRPKTIKSNIGRYDADYGIFPITVDSIGTFYLQVPVAEAAKVKDKWYSATIHPTYGIAEDRIAIASAEVEVNGTKYKTADKYETTPNIAIDLPPLQIDLGGGTNIAKKESPAVIDNSIDINIPTNSGNNSKTFAIIIGNEDYQQVSKVPYAKNDAKIFAAYCEKTLGLPQKNIKLYNDATYGIMLSAVENIQSIAKAFKGDINIIFYYAGHGVPNESTNEAFLLPVDAKGNNTAICYSINKLLKELKELNANSVTVFMDACFSGAQRGEGMLASARGVAIKAKKVEPQGNMVVFSAASADETAYPYKEKGHGMFTYFLLKKLNETKGDVTLGELGDYICEKVSQESVVSNGKNQTPTVTASQSLSENWRNSKLR